MAAKHSSDEIETTAVEAPDLESAASDAPRHGFFVRLYTGTGAFEVIGRRKLWYGISGLIVALAIAAILIRRNLLTVHQAPRIIARSATPIASLECRTVCRLKRLENAQIAQQ